MNKVSKYSNIPYGDMPGDKVNIEETHINKAELILPSLIEKIREFEKKGQEKIVLSVYGGSGVGKSEIASLLGYMLGEEGYPSYILSGDNYPRRIPKYNDIERLRVYRESGIKNIVSNDMFVDEVANDIQSIQNKDMDADKTASQDKWYKCYIEGAKSGLKEYLGSNREINFEEVSGIIKSFKSNAKEIYLRRLGRNISELWYDKIDMSQKKILIIEWTHGNNENLTGVDYKIFLNSTPKETLEHRRKRNRDKGVDSPFVTLVLELEQELLFSQSKNADMIVSLSGEIISLDRYLEIMKDHGYCSK